MDSKPKRQYPELQEQRQVVRFLREQVGYGNVLKFTALAQNTFTGWKQISMNSMAGVEKGFTDLVIALKHCNVFLEMKLPRRMKLNGELGASPSRVDPHQEEWNVLLNRFAPTSKAFIAYGADEAIKILTSLIGDVLPPKETVTERKQRSDEFQSFIDGPKAKV